MATDGDVDRLWTEIGRNRDDIQRGRDDLVRERDARIAGDDAIKAAIEGRRNEGSNRTRAGLWGIAGALVPTVLGAIIWLLSQASHLK